MKVRIIKSLGKEENGYPLIHENIYYDVKSIIETETGFWLIKNYGEGVFINNTEHYLLNYMEFMKVTE